MKLIIDAMGGDNAPHEIVRGVLQAAETLSPDITYLLVGREDALSPLLAGADKALLSRISIHPAESVLTMEDDPFDVVRAKKDSSMAVALHLLADGAGDALVSAGNTGALFTGASMIVRTVPGVRRAAIASVLPFDRPLLLMDAGANVTVTSELLEQFAIMGDLYAHHVLGVESPEIGLANNGAESHKGTPLQVETYARLKETPDIRFVGNVEGKEIPFGVCDVLLCDGFTGNIILKMTEGMGAFLFSRLKKMYGKGPLTRLSALIMRGELRQMKHDFDPSEQGGSPLLGIARPVIKSHGSSDAKAIMNACRRAAEYAESDLTEALAVRIARAKQRKKEKEAEKTAENKTETGSEIQ